MSIGGAAETMLELLILAASSKLKVVLAALAGSSVALGGSIIAQVTLDDLGILPQLGAGGFIALSGLYALRIVLRAAAHERESASETEARLVRDLARAEARADDLEAELHKANERSRRLLIAYDRERAYRITLEQAGIVERRHTPPELEPDKLLEPGDLHAIGIHPEELQTPPNELGGL